VVGRGRWDSKASWGLGTPAVSPWGLLGFFFLVYFLYRGPLRYDNFSSS
jgi:hypothetical protein